VTPISRLRCSTGEDWLSWPVGTLPPAINQAKDRFAGRPDVIASITQAIQKSDERIGALGAGLIGLWVPDALAGTVVGEFWAGLQREPEPELRSALRYQRSIAQRSSADVTVFSQSVASFRVHDTDAVTLVESCAEENGRPLVRVTVVYFPTGSIRPILRGICFVADLAEQFTAAIGQVAGTVTWLSDETTNTTEVPHA